MTEIDYRSLPFHPKSEQLVHALMAKCNNTDPNFFRMMVANQLAVMPASMNVSVDSAMMDEIPINCYSLLLATSGCVDRDTEYLTPSGWKRIEDFSEGDKVLEVSPYDNFNSSFAVPEDYIKLPCMEPVNKISPDKRSKMSMVLSDEHKVLIDTRGKLSAVRADELLSNSLENVGIPSNYNLVSNVKVDLSDDEIRLMVAVSADAYMPDVKHGIYDTRVRVKKENKIHRLLSILERLDIEFTQAPDGESVAFRFNSPIRTKSLDWAWNCNAHQLSVIAHESIHWDGSTDSRTGNYKYFTTLKGNADLMQHAYNVTFDTVTSLLVSDRVGRVREVNETQYITGSVDYVVTQTSSRVKNISPQKVSKVQMVDGYKYCFTTSTGFWLARKDNYVFVTGNSGKGKSLNYIESKVLDKFKTRYLGETMPVIVEDALMVKARANSIRNNSDEDEEFLKLQKEYNEFGAYRFVFAEGTAPAVKQLRDKITMAGIGAVNYTVDEIGVNLVKNTELMDLCLELYDLGQVKTKLTKNTSENKRSSHDGGRTPTNVLLFGTPVTLLDGDKVEGLLTNYLDMGYARRCLFSYSDVHNSNDNLSIDELYELLVNSDSEKDTNKLSVDFEKLADPALHNQRIMMLEPEEKYLLRYKVHCEQLAAHYEEHETIAKAELMHRYFKAYKLAGLYAFIDSCIEVEQSHIEYAIRIVEESGHCFKSILNRERQYVKLAKYISTVKEEVTHVDILEALPFYNCGVGKRMELMKYATAWGIKNNIIIKHSQEDGVDFYKGESLKEVDLSEVMVSYSGDITTDYENVVADFTQLHELTNQNGLHWTSHHLDGKEGYDGGYRDEDHVLTGFDLIVIDVDGEATIETVESLLSDYTYHIYTTKRHSEEENRFRVILPMSHRLNLSRDEYKSFMTTVYEWLPFGCDTQTAQRSRKWQCYATDYSYNDGALVDVLPFIPKTSKNKDYISSIKDLRSLNNMERWFLNNMEDGRNNTLLKYAMVLSDAGMNLMDVQSKVIGLNARLDDPLKEDEITSTIMTTVAKKIQG